VTTPKRISLLLALGACLAAAGCGSDDEEGAPLPADNVQLLESRLVETENRLGDGSLGACEDILNDTRPEVARVLESLPSDVDADVRDALAQSFDNLWSLVEQECAEIAADEPADEEPAPAPEPPETDTDTTPTDTTETDTIPIDPGDDELPPDGDGSTPPGEVPGVGNGNGNGNGGGVGPGGANKGGGE